MNIFKKIINKNQTLSLFLSGLISFLGVFILSPYGTITENGYFIFLGLLLGLSYFIVMCNLVDKTTVIKENIKTKNNIIQI